MLKNYDQVSFESFTNFLSKLAEKSDHVYWLSSPDFKQIAYVSPSYETIWGRPREILYKTPEVWLEYLFPEDAINYNPIQAMAERVALLGPAARYEENYRIVRPDGKIRWILDRGFPIYDENNQCCGVTGVAIDITKEKRAEQALREAKEVAMKTEFLENMRHDIRTSLNGIQGFGQLIHDESENEKIKEYTENLLISCRALTHIHNQILNAARVFSGHLPEYKKKFDLQTKLQQVMDLNLAKACSKKLNFVFEHDPKIPRYLIGDSKRICSIALELVVNALKYTEEGHVKIKTELQKKENHECVIKLVINDTGIGIPVEQQENIFTRFKRLTPAYEGKYKGLGLGLSLIKQFVDDIHGEMYIESQIQQGTTFTCYFPLRESVSDTEEGLDQSFDMFDSEIEHEEAVVKKSIADTSVSSDNKSRILLVEDVDVAVMVAKAILEQLSCMVDVAVNGTEAIQKATTNRYDLIFMDVGLPDIDGNAVTRHIRALERDTEQHVSIIALTAHVDADSKQLCVEAGMDAVLNKPLMKEKAEDILNAFIPNRKPTQKLEIKSESKAQTESKIIDFQAAVAAMNNDEKLVHEMLKMMMEGFPTELKGLDAAHGKKDWEGIRAIAHKLKGVASYCGTMRLKDVSTALDRAVKDGKIELFDELYEKLITEIQVVEEMVKNKSYV